MANKTSPVVVYTKNIEGGIPVVVAVDTDGNTDLSGVFEQTASDFPENSTVLGRLVPGEKYLMSTIAANELKRLLNLDL